MKKILISLLSCLLLASCQNGLDNNSKAHGYAINCWHDFNTKDHNYYDLKINVSTYFEEDYLVIGVILGKDISFSFSKKILSSSNDENIRYNLFEFQDSTGQEVTFNEIDGYEYKFDSSRTIKVSYANLNDSEKDIIENSSFYYVNNICFMPFHNENETDIKKVQFNDDLNLVTF